MFDKIKKYIKENYISIYLILNIIYITIINVIATFDDHYYDFFGKSIVVLFVISLFFVIFLVIKKKKFILSDLLLLIIIILGIISTIFAYSILDSIFGIDGRYEGLFTIIYYFSLLFMTSFIDINKRKIIVIFILLFGLVNACFAFLELIGFIRWATGRYLWPCGITSNPNFMGSIMVISVSYSIGLFIDSDDYLEKIIYLLFILIFIFGLFVCNTTSAIVGLIVVLLFTIVYIIKFKKFKELAFIILLLIIIPLFLHSVNKTTFLKDFLKTGNEVVEISKGNVNDNFGSKRIKVWKETLKYVPKYLLHGIGIDNYYYVFEGRPLVIGNHYYDKAHNEFLQILITQGIFSLISYLILYFIIVMDGIINCFKGKKLYFILPVIGYLVQAFFNISVIEVAPMFFIGLGLLIDRDKLYLNKEIIKR